MSLQINIISNIHNGSGLQRDYEILKHELETMGHTVVGIDYRQASHLLVKADLNLWLEVAQPTQLLPTAKQNWLIPNPEWWRPQWDPIRFDRILCKTLDAQRIFGRHPNCNYVGFMSVDRYVASEKKLEFLHVAGKSPFKNTLPILQAWKTRLIPYRLTLVGLRGFPTMDMPEVRHLEYVSNLELCELYSSCAFHLCPSEYEGWGHALHEGLSGGGIVVTTDSPLMREFDLPGNVMIPSRYYRRHLRGDMYRIESKDVINTVLRVADMPASEAMRISSESRHRYLDDTIDFRVRFAEQMDTL